MPGSPSGEVSDVLAQLSRDVNDSIGEFRVDVEQSDGLPASVAVTGELDIATADQLETALRQLSASAASTKGAVVDLGNCSFVDSSGLRAILVGARLFAEAGADGAAARPRLVLAAPGPSVLRVLEISGVDQGVPIFATSAEAVEAVAAD